MISERGTSLCSPWCSEMPSSTVNNATGTAPVWNRIRSASEWLTNPKDVQVVREYLTELETKAARQEASDHRRIAGVRH